MNDVVKIIDKNTGQENTAVYAKDVRGNLRYNVDGKLLSDKAFDRKYSIVNTSTTPLSWRVNTCQLFKEIVENGGQQTGIFRQPLMIMKSILAEISERALQLNDPQLNALMCRLSLYEQSDPYSKEYNEVLTNKTIGQFYNKIP